MLTRPKVPEASASEDVFLASLLSRPAWFRLVGAGAVMVVLWLLIVWAVVLP